MTYDRLNLASGDLLFCSNWINLDIQNITIGTKECMFVRADLTKYLPFYDETIDVIYTSHFLEHLDPFVECRSFLVECYRILKHDGIMRISVPDFRKIAEIYLYNPKHYFKEYNYIKPWFRDTKCWSRRLGVSVMHDHKMIYDIDSLVEIVMEAGFSDVLEVCVDSKGFLTEEKLMGIVPTHIGHSLVVDVKK